MDDPARAAATSPEPVERAEFLAVVAVTLLGALCRLAALRQPMRYDEASAWADFIGQSWWTILSRYPTPNNHVFFSLVAKVTASLAPYQPWAIRLPALIPGIAIVPATWAVGRRLADRATALLGAALAAGSMPLVLYSANARGHSLVVLGGLGLVLLADRLRVRPRWLAGWAAYVLVAALGLWTALLMIYSIAAVSLWLGLHALSQSAGPASEWGGTQGDIVARVRRALPQLGRVVAADATALALAALLYLPIIRSAGLSALLANKLVLPVPWPQFARLLPPFLYELVLTWSSPLSTLSLLWVVALFVLALVGLPRAHRGGPSFALAAIGGCLAPFLFSHAHPFVRMWLFFVPLFLLAAGRGIVRVATAARIPLRLARALRIPARADLAWGTLSVALVVSAVALTSRAAEGTDDTGRFAAANGVAGALAPQLRAGDRVLAAIPLNAPLLWYFGARGLDTAALNTPITATRRAFLVLDATRGQTLQRAVDAGIIDPALFEPPTLVVRFEGAEVWRAERRDTPPRLVSNQGVR